MSGKNTDSAEVNFNPLKVFVISLCAAFFFGEIYNFYLQLHLIFKFFGFFIIFFCIILFIYCIRIFLHHNESLPPSSPTYKIIKTGIYSYTRNPIYICFVSFQFGMFMLFGNFIYLLSSIILFFWIHFKVVLKEEKYLEKKFTDIYERYKANVPRWIIW